MKTGIRHAVRLVLALSAAAVAGQSEDAFAQAENEAAEQQSIPPPPAAGGGVTEEVVVIGRQKSAATDIVEERLDQEVAVDLLGAEQISRVGDSTVSLALRRLPGVTLVSDKFIYVRGLGERYSSTTLNGAYVPSPDLTRNVIPLDIFPAEIIDSLSVNKGFTADMPAAFGGGSVDIRTTGIPEDFVLGFQVGSGWNSQSDGSALTYRGGSDDWLGSDDGTRALPSEIRTAIQDYQGDFSTLGILEALNRDGQQHTIADAQLVNRQLITSLYRNVDIQEGSSDPDINAEATVGNSWYFGEQEDWRIGFLALGDYGNNWRDRERVNRSVATPDTVAFNTRTTSNNVSVTGSLNLGLDYGDDHKIVATGMYLRSSEDEASVAIGNNSNYQQSDGRQLRTYRMRFEERELELMQFRGSHTLGYDTLELLGGIGKFLDNAVTRDLNYSWYYSDATAKTDIPNELTLSAEDAVDPQSGALVSTSLRQSASAAEYRYTDLRDEVKSYGWSLNKPLEAGDFKIGLSGGADFYQKGRGYLQTQLNVGSNNPAALAGLPGQVLTDSNILDPTNGFGMTLGGIGTESYLAAEVIDAAFAKFDVNWNQQWRVTGGVRWEDFKQLAVPVDQYEFDIDVPKIPIPVDQLPSLVTAEDDYYPSLAVTYIVPDFWAEQFQLRFGWSQTVTRPDLREVSAATYIDPLTDARVRGNPDLLTADLTNYDIRAEWFFDSGDNFTVSGFYKDISNPIETIEAAGSDDNVGLTFVNAQSAELYGIEVEGLKGLGFLADRLGGWTDAVFVSGNLTLSDSKLTVGSQALSLTNNQRRMTQHSKFVGNLQLGFDSPSRVHSASLVYNVFGKRIYFAGRNQAKDAYEQPFHSVDVVYSFYPTDSLSFKFRVQNLLDEAVEVKRHQTLPNNVTGPNITVLEQEVGMTFKLDAKYEF